MSYYTERHGLRSPVERTETITYEMYALLFACCEKYYNNVAWLYPEECPDGHGCCGLDYTTFDTTMKFEIPTSFRKRIHLLLQMNTINMLFWTLLSSSQQIARM